MTSSFPSIAGRAAGAAVAEMGYESMTPIQAQGHSVVLTGKDVMGRPDRHRQDSGVFAAVAAPAQHENSSISGSPPGARGAAAHARTG